MESVFRKFLVALGEEGVDAVVCGGVACILHGVRRVTADLDLSVRLDAVNLAGFIRVAERFELKPRVPEPVEALASPERRRAWVQDKGAMVFTLRAQDAPFSVDVFLTYPVPHDELVASAWRIDVGGQAALVSSVDHLLVAKLAIADPRTEDRRDIEDLTRIVEAQRRGDES